MIKVNRFLNWLLPYWFKETFIYKPHRAIHGWARNDMWDFDLYLSKVLVESLTYKRNHDSSYPSTYNSSEEWDSELEDIIQAFQDYIDYKEKRQFRHERFILENGEQSFKQWLEENSDNTPEFDKILTFLNKPSEIPNEKYREYFRMEDENLKQIKERMKRIIDVWENLWD